MKDTDEMIESKNDANTSKRSSGIAKIKNKRFYKNSLSAAKYTILGREINEGLLFKAFLYLTFIATSYIYLDPILKMIVNMYMSPADMFDPTKTWIPSSFHLENLYLACDCVKYIQDY